MPKRTTVEKVRDEMVTQKNRGPQQSGRCVNERREKAKTKSKEVLSLLLAIITEEDPKNLQFIFGHKTGSEYLPEKF